MLLKGLRLRSLLDCRLLEIRALRLETLRKELLVVIGNLDVPRISLFTLKTYAPRL